MDTLNTLIHRLWVRAKEASADGSPYDQAMWESMSAQVSELQQNLKDEKKKSAYWQEKARLRGEPAS